MLCVLLFSVCCGGLYVLLCGLFCCVLCGVVCFAVWYVVFCCMFCCVVCDVFCCVVCCMVCCVSDQLFCDDIYIFFVMSDQRFSIPRD